MRLPAALVFLALAHAATAAESAPASPGTPPADAAGPASSASGDEQESAPAGAEPSPDVFVPSEDISEDLSIAFPIDV